MELTAWPKTEAEYWQAVKDMERFMFLLADSPLEQEGACLIKMQRATLKSLRDMLLNEIKQHFRVLHPEESPRFEAVTSGSAETPEGYISFYSWYERMQRQVRESEFEQIICSACPLCGDKEIYVQNERIPCRLYNGSLYYLPRPYRCALLDFTGLWSVTGLLEKIREKGGKKAVNAFIEKIAELARTEQPRSERS